MLHALNFFISHRFFTFIPLVSPEDFLTIMSSLSFSTPHPTDEQSQEEIDSLTPEELQEAERDKFGRNQVIIQETPQMIQVALECLNEEIQNTREKEAYELAEMYCPEYVRSTDFRLMFLRCTKFDANQAAQKMVQYWSRKVELFGPDRAFRKISILDFDEDEADTLALNSGGFRALPEPDQFGRGILFSYRNRWTNNTKSMVRLIWFVVHVLLEDEDVQKKGIVGIFANTGATSRGELCNSSTHRYNTKTNRICWRDVQQALPLQVRAGYCYISSSVSKLLLNDARIFAIGKLMRARLCFYRTFGDFLLALGEHGIGANIRPTELSGSLDFNYEEWLEERRRTAIINDEIV